MAGNGSLSGHVIAKPLSGMQTEKASRQPSLEAWSRQGDGAGERSGESPVCSGM